MTSFRSLLYLLSTAVLLVRSSYILDQAEKVYPNDEVREKNLISALDTLKRLRLEAAKENNGRPQKPKSNTDATVLCVTFIEPSFQHLAVAEYNMKASSKYCDDWGVLYVGDDDLKIMQSLENATMLYASRTQRRNRAMALSIYAWSEKKLQTEESERRAGQQ